MQYRTDLAAECDILTKPSLPKGISQQTVKAGDIEIHRVEITDQDGAQLAGKPEGVYITITVPSFSQANDTADESIETIAQELNAMLPEKGLVLIVGLGNNDITPDAVGPRTIHQVLATRHIGQEMAEQCGLAGLRPAAAIAPGVLGQTGIETSEVIRSIVRDIKPVAVVVVDALAARSASRLGCTVQISSSGISPGSGVMNARKELSEATLGVPVVSMGVPTVVDASTLAGDLLKDDSDKLEHVRELFELRGNTMMITPREIDVLIGHACKTLSLSINKALQPHLTLEDIGYLVS